MISSFLKAFAGAKASQLGQSLTEAIVRFDPETASEAQIAEYQDRLTFLTTRVAALRTAYRTEQDQADQYDAQYKRYCAAATILQKQVGEADPSKKDGLQASLNDLLTKMESLAPQRDREKKEAADANVILKQFEDAAAQMAQQVAAARGKLNEAKQSMESASLAKDRAKDNAEQAAVLAGVQTHTDTLDVALNAMHSAAAKDNEAADAANLKAQLLHQASPTSIDTDPNVAAALAAASGAAAAPVTSEDRLAALMAKA